jgi:hypothetical protein
MDFVVCNRSSTESSSALAKVTASCAIDSGADFAGGDEDRVVELLGQLQHSVLFGKLPDILEDINDPVSLHDGLRGGVEFVTHPDITRGRLVKLTNIDPAEMAGPAAGKLLKSLREA